MRGLIFSILIVLVSFGWSKDRPNIILIMADDMGWSDVGCYGSEIATPNIDRIAKEGLQWTQFYNNGKCTTTRASLLTGLYPRNGGKGIELINGEMVTLAEALRLAGYQTGLSGKWHNGSKAPHRPIDRGFQKSYGLWDGCCNFFNPAQPDPKFKGGRVRVFGEDDQLISEFSEDYYTTDAFTDHALKTIRDQAGNGKPFFHYIAHTAPHYPLHARPEDIEKYKGKYAEGWDALRKARYQPQVELGLIDPKLYPEPGYNPDNKPYSKAKNSDLEWEMLRMEVYAAMIDRMDWNIGRVLDLLDELKIANNTLVIFLSDNGACAETPGGAGNTEHRPGPKEWYSHVGPNWAYAQNAPFRYYKAVMHEGGINTPCVMRWPDQIKAGVKTDAIGHIIDFMPTFLAMAGAEYPTLHQKREIIPVEGIDLNPVFANPENQLQRDQPVFWHWNGKRAVRNGQWKLTYLGDEWQLYDFSTNRTETKPVTEEHPEIVEAMAADWQKWAAKTGVKVKKPKNKKK